MSHIITIDLDMGDCSVCCEKYNRQNHKKVDCYFCDFSACRVCIQTYLLSTTNDPHCMSCKNAWNREFVDQSCTKVFRNSKLKEHREQILLEREKCLLPQTQVLVERKRQQIELRKRLEEVKDEIVRQRDLQWELERQLHRLDAGYDLDTSVGAKKKFVRKCPIENCKGFLSSDWKCGMCSVKICSKCNEPDGDDHECDPNNVETVNLLKKDTKPCPTCGTMIFKISGCSQMWCPDCHTAFNWNTGQIETGIIHNPHFYEFQRRVGGGQQNRNLGDIPCGGMPNVRELSYFLNPEQRSLPPNLYAGRRITNVANPEHEKLYNIHRAANHAHTYEIPMFRNGMADNSDLRVDYLMDVINEGTMKTQLQRREKAREKNRDISNVLQMFYDTTSDYFRQLVVNEVSVTECNAVLDQLVEYFNTSMETIHKRYNCVTPYISENLTMEHRTYKVSVNNVNI